MMGKRDDTLQRFKLWVFFRTSVLWVTHVGGRLVVLVPAGLVEVRVRAEHVHHGGTAELTGEVQRRLEALQQHNNNSYLTDSL